MNVSCSPDPDVKKRRRVATPHRATTASTNVGVRTGPGLAVASAATDRLECRDESELARSSSPSSRARVYHHRIRHRSRTTRKISNGPIFEPLTSCHAWSGSSATPSADEMPPVRARSSESLARISTSNTQRERKGEPKIRTRVGVTRKSLAPHWVSYVGSFNIHDTIVAKHRPA